VLLEDAKKDTEKSVERLMGTKPEERFAFIRERAEFAGEKAPNVLRHVRKKHCSASGSRFISASLRPGVRAPRAGIRANTPSILIN
jgi:hypothetical protein